MFCKRCGKPLEPGAAFCMGCGTRVEAGFQDRGLHVENYGDDDETATIDVRNKVGVQKNPQQPNVHMGVPGNGAPGGQPAKPAQETFGETERLSQADMPESLRQFDNPSMETQLLEEKLVGGRPILRGNTDPKSVDQNRDVVNRMNENVQKMVVPKKKPINKKKLIIILSSIAAVLLIAGGILYWLLVIRADKKFDQASVNQQMYSDNQVKSYGSTGFNDGTAVSFEEKESDGDGRLYQLKVSGKSSKTISLPGEITNIYQTGGICIVDGCAYTRVVCDDKNGTQAVVLKADIKKGKCEILYRTGLSGSINPLGCRFLSLFYAYPDGFYVFEQADTGYKVQKVDWFGKKDGKSKITVGDAFVPGVKGEKLIAADETNSNVVSVALKSGKKETLFSLSALPEELGGIVTIYQSKDGLHYVFNEEGVLFEVEGTSEPSVTRIISMKELSYESDSLNIHAEPVLLNDQKNYYIPFFFTSGEGSSQVGLVQLDSERGSLGGEVLYSEKGVNGMQVKGDTLRILSGESGFQKEAITERLSKDTFTQARGNMESDLVDYCNGKIGRNDLDSSISELKAADQAGYSYIKEAADLLQEAVDYYNEEGFLSAYRKANEAISTGEELGNIYTEKCGKLIVANCLSNGLRHYEEMAQDAFENGDLKDFEAKIKTLQTLYADDPESLASISEFAAKFDFAAGNREEDLAAFKAFVTDKILHKEGTQILDKEIAYFEADGVHVVHCLNFVVEDFDGDGHLEMFLYTWREALDGSAPCGEAAIYDANGGNVTKTVYGRSPRMNPMRLDFYGSGNLRVSGFSENGYADMYIGTDTEKAAALSCGEGQVLCVNHDREKDEFNVWREYETGSTSPEKMDNTAYDSYEKTIRAGDIHDVEVLSFTQSSLDKVFGN